MADSDSEGEIGIFQEPEGYYEPEKEPTFVTHKLLDGRELNLRLVGHNPLWVGQMDGEFPYAYYLTSHTYRMTHAWSLGSSP